MAEDITAEALQAMAADIGLDRLTEEHLEQLLRATRVARARRRALPTDDLAPADEPAHIFRLDR